MILLLNRSFHPDREATGQFLTDLAVELAKRFPVTAVCGRSYGVDDGFRGLIRRERHQGVRILRVRHSRFDKRSFWGRLANWFTFLGLAFWASVRERPRFIFVHTDPPLLGAIALLLRRLRRARIIFNCRDLYPDVALELGVVAHGPASRLMDALNVRAFREASAVVALGNDMAGRIAAKGVPRDRLLVIPDWVDTAAIRPVPRAENEYVRSLKLEGRFTLMYSGNIGLTQDFETSLQAAARLAIDRSLWTLLLVGGGAGLARIETRVRELGLDNTIFLPSQPREKLAALLGAGSLHLVPLKRGLAGCVVPSKIYGIMAAGRPFLAVCDAGCDMASLAREEGAGLWAPAGDIEAVQRALERAIRDPGELDRLGEAGRRLAVVRYDARRVMAKWVELFENLSRL